VSRPRRTLPVAAALLLCLTASACGGSTGRDTRGQTTPAPAPRGSTPFDYDASRPLDVRDAGRANKNYPIVLRDVSYASDGRRVEGFLALPPGAARRPGVVFLHGSGGDRGQLVVQAMWLAARGSVTLAITAPSARTKDTSQGLTPVQALRRQRDLSVRDVVAVRRAVDVLRARPEVDPARLGFVGWSAGARTGALLAGVEHRIGAFVLMSGGAAPVSVYASQAPAALRDDVRRLLGPVDPLRTIAKARPGTLLLQDGRQDEVVPRGALEDLATATPDGTDIRWYDAGHELDTKAYRDQLAWLARKLGIRDPVPGALTGPRQGRRAGRRTPTAGCATAPTRSTAPPGSRRRRGSPQSARSSWSRSGRWR
jgi:dienelactone hydrolase